MNIIKKIPNIKSDRNLIIYDNSMFNNIDKINYTQKNVYSLNFVENQIKLFKKKHNLQNWMETDIQHIYLIYYGNIYNPPFFNNIMVFRKILTDENLKQIWNMTLLNGYILLNSLYKHLFTESIIYETNDKVLIQKNIRLTYQFRNYRILDFIIAGTMKGGTTAAITNLSTHPDVSMVDKEIHFFDDKRTYQLGIDWYKKHFNYNKKMVGDKAPDVMYQTSCLELLQIVNPQLKIILMLRNPIARAYSHWKMLRDSFGDTNSFEYMINDEIKNKWNENRIYKISFRSQIIQRGLYFEQIQNILKYFSSDNLLILISEKIRKNMTIEYQKIFDFLELHEHSANYVEEFVSKKEDILPEDDILYKKLKKIYSKDVKNLEKMLGYKTNWW